MWSVQGYGFNGVCLAVLPPTLIDAHCHQSLMGLQFDRTISAHKNGIKFYWIRTQILTDFHRYLGFFSFYYPGTPCSSVSPKWKFLYFWIRTQIFTDFHRYLVFVAFIIRVIRVHPCPPNGNSYTFELGHRFSRIFTDFGFCSFQYPDKTGFKLNIYIRGRGYNLTKVLKKYWKRRVFRNDTSKKYWKRMG